MTYPSEYIRVCNDCWAVFRTDKAKKQYCPECAARRNKESVSKHNRQQNSLYKKPKAKKKILKPALSIKQICRIQKLYNEDNNTWLSYGEIVRKIETGEIRVTIINGAVDYVREE